MVKLRCNCLNVCVETVGSDLREVDGSLFVSDEATDSFFSEKLYEVQLAVGGIIKEVEFLMRQRYVQDWVVFKCLGCNTEPFALHSVKGQDRVLVNRNIQRDPEKIAHLLKSGNHSPAFKIILNSASEEELNVGNGFSNESISAAGVIVQDHVKRYLKSEEEAMEERIRCYTTEQKRQFTLLQARAFNDKRAMLSILRKAAESRVEESLSDAMADVSETDSGKVFDERPVRPSGYRLPDVTNIRILPASSSTNSKTRKENYNDPEGDHFHDPLFATDEDCQPFVDSDEEESSDNSFNQKDEDEKASYLNRTKYSSSVPVNVPFLHNSKCRKTERLVDEEDGFEAPTPDKIAESIQALARSVQDSRDIFGELPRPRINTLPFQLT